MKNMSGDAAQQVKKYQKRLIPVDIVIAILAFVAAFTLLFAPLIRIDLGKAAQVLVEESGSSDSGESQEIQDELVNSTLGSFDGVYLSVTTMDLAKFSFSEKPMDAITDIVTDSVEDAAPKVVTNVLLSSMKASLDEAIESASGSNKQELQRVRDSLENVSTDKILSYIDKLEKANPATKNDVIEELADYVLGTVDLSGSDTGSIKDDVCEVIGELYDNTVKYNNGKFTLEACICVTVSLLMNEENSEPSNTAATATASTTDPEVYTTYDELFDNLLQGSEGEGEGSGSSSADDLQKTLAMVAEYGRYFCFVMFLIVALWFLLGFIATLRTLCANKRVTMWYVKLFGAIPWLLFGLVPLVASSLFAKIPDLAPVAGIFGAISSFTWVSGVCYILLWLVSIFWAFPIKHKVRKYKKQLKREAKG